jgi:pimeloyl-ACP methyl ester carboxylesterase
VTSRRSWTVSGSPDSDVLSKARAQRMVKALPKGELVVVPGVGHAPTLTEPVVVDALERFLGRPGT